MLKETTFHEIVHSQKRSLRIGNTDLKAMFYSDIIKQNRNKSFKLCPNFNAENDFVHAKVFV